jgi:ABC transporter substrate binding protein
VAWQPNVILSRATAVTAALLQQTRTVPIVFEIVSNPVGDGFVDSMAKPGRNATRFTNVEASLVGKWLELLKEIDPKISRTAVAFDPKTSPGGGAYYLRLIKGAARFKIYFCHETRPGMDGEPEAMQFDDCDDEAQTEAQALRMPAPVGAIEAL